MCSHSKNGKIEFQKSISSIKDSHSLEYTQKFSIGCAVYTGQYIYGIQFVLFSCIGEHTLSTVNIYYCINIGPLIVDLYVPKLFITVR